MTSYVRTLQLDDQLIAPYGGLLIQAFVPAAERHAVHARLPELKRVEISARELFDVEMIASGAYSPLSGFMNQASYQSVLANMSLPNGMYWGLPVTLAVTAELAQTLNVGEELALCRHGDVVGVMQLEEIYPWDAGLEVSSLGQSDAQNYTQIEARRASQAKFLLGGPIALLAARSSDWQQKYHYWPTDLRNQTVQNEWHKIAAIHLHNPWQRSDEYLLKCALEASDALLLQISNDNADEKSSLLPSVLKGASKLLLENYFPNDRILENRTPSDLFSNSLRAVLQHAIISQNYGCESFFLPLQKELANIEQPLKNLFDAATKHGLTVRIMLLEQPFYCELCGGIATEKSCPHDAAGRVNVSDADIAANLLSGKSLPPTVARPDVARAVARGMADKAERGNAAGPHIYPHVSEISRELLESMTGHKAGVLWMTGLSGSGKSTIAHRVERELLLSGHRVYVLDGDTLRTGLNRDLGFGEEARRENLRRAGEVVKIMVDAGMIVIAAFISPFIAERKMVREIIGAGYFEVYVEADLETCEERDPKGLYKRARAGVIPKFTGVSSPYEVPETPDLRLNTSTQSLNECTDQLWSFMERAGLLRSSK
jgi:adenylyl-sulfate kinase